MLLEDQLRSYIEDVSSNDDFSNLTGICELIQKMGESIKHVSYPLVYFFHEFSFTLTYTSQRQVLTKHFRR